MDAVEEQCDNAFDVELQCERPDGHDGLHSGFDPKLKTTLFWGHIPYVLTEN